MLFNSFSFLIFFPTVTVLYFLVPQAYRWFFLLTASCIFYMAFIPVYVLVLALTISIDYTAALFIEKSEGRRRKWYLIISIVSTCTVLFIFKYFNFFNSNLGQVARFFHWNYSIENLSLILPIGLSFHTFQSLSYVIEVYRKNYKAEHHFGIYALYVMFYPQLVAGPIERPGNLLPQFYEKHFFDYQRVIDGLKLMVWGFFKKVVIADRLALVVDKVYSDPTQYTGLPLIAAAISFAIQVYCDFSGYSDIAIGSAQVMGFRLMDNFNRPLFSASVPDFWRRWHISLMTWFRDYVYIPLGGNRVDKGRWYFNIFFTFTLSGLWHGANWGMVLWGSFNGLYVILSDLTENLRKRGLTLTRLDHHPFLHRGLGIALTFFLFWFTLIIFRTRNLSDALYVMTHLGTGLMAPGGLWTSVESLYRVLPKYELITVLIAIGWMIFIETIEKQGKMRHPFSEKPVWARWTVYYVCILFLIFFGEYNDQAFIYFQF
ncbi:MAG: alginate O-acetyltransferase [Deltaproteobacteria bacterium RBG_16_48_10]|nr:MAG: alginate O-acetyltransferase [Deltaproteobacteria bacterium RBG_16_48_10]